MAPVVIVPPHVNNLVSFSVECLLLCIQLWLATSYSEIITKKMDNVVSCEGGRGEFPWNDDTKPLLKVEYYFQNKIIAKSSRPNFSSVVYKDENLKSRLLKNDNIAFRIEHVTEKDRGEYKIVLTYTDGDRLELVGSLDVTGNCYRCADISDNIFKRDSNSQLTDPAQL
ncbi:uncharacterized protein [Haliotis cracherodii]|uniref:uncharacterized protein n=1 Tax=Haliotis cracherodii TaxID=6455 RepID=UPI0039E74888